MKGNTRSFFTGKIHFPDAKSRWTIIVFITLWVFLILYSLQPFGINFAKNKLVITALNTFGVFSVCLICIQGMPLVFKKYYTSDKWTSGKFFGFCLMVITLFSVLNTFVISVYIDNLEEVPYYTGFPLLQRFFMFFKASFFASVFPIAIIYYILWKKGKEEEGTLTQAVTHDMMQTNDEEDAQVIELSGKTKDHIRLLPEDILYAQASGNYVAIYYLKNGKEDRKLLRISMSELGDSLCDYPYIIRCHRAFMVNIQKMDKIHGNLKGYHMELKDTDVKIPVSKSYTRIVKEKIMHADVY